MDLCDEEFFIKWDIKKILSEILKNKDKKKLFIDRKRLFIKIIPAQEDIQSLLFTSGMLFNDTHLQNLKLNPLFNKKQGIEDVRNKSLTESRSWE